MEAIRDDPKPCGPDILDQSLVLHVTHRSHHSAALLGFIGTIVPLAGGGSLRVGIDTP